MAGPLLGVCNRSGQSPVHRPTLPQRSLLVADRGEQRVREANPRVIELDDVFLHGWVECLDHIVPVTVGSGNQLDRRTGERRSVDEEIAGLCGQPGESAAE